MEGRRSESKIVGSELVTKSA
nr:hypothetical protein [Tanacetum cinerariifolium]